MRTWRRLAVASAIVMAVVGSGAAIAAISSLSVGTMKSAKFVRSDDWLTRTGPGSDTYATIPGASTSISLPGDGVIRARFSSGAMCRGKAATVCLVRILISGVQAPPGEMRMTQVLPDGSGLWGAHSVEASHRLPQGFYNVSVQWRNQTGVTTNTFHLQNYHLSVEAF